MRTILAIDSDKHATATYAANFPGVEVRCAKVEDELDRLPDADLIVGGFPCQPHSLAGKRKASADERDGGQTVIDAVRRKQPRQFLFENVAGLITSEGGRYYRWFVRELEACGYDVWVQVMDAVEFGAPQFRQRVWFWGVRKDLKLKRAWPKPTHAWPWPTAGMFGGELGRAITVGWALNIPHMQADGEWFEGSGISGIRRIRGSDVERRDHEIGEPCPTVMAPTGGKSGLCKVMGGQRRGGVGHEMPLRDLTAEPCQGISVRPAVHEYRWSDAMLAKHPPASPASTVQAKYGKGGAEGLVEVQMAYGAHGHNEGKVCGVGEPSDTLRGAVPGCSDAVLITDDPKHQPHQPHQPANSLTSGGKGHGPTENTLKLSVDGRTWESRHAPATPAPTVRARSPRDGGRCTENVIDIPKKLVRRLTVAECLRLMSAPDSFQWPAKITKTAQYRIVGNGQCSIMTARLGECLRAADPELETVVSLFCGGGLGDLGLHGRFWQYSP